MKNNYSTEKVLRSVVPGAVVGMAIFAMVGPFLPDNFVVWRPVSKSSEPTAKVLPAAATYAPIVPVVSTSTPLVPEEETAEPVAHIPLSAPKPIPMNPTNDDSDDDLPELPITAAPDEPDEESDNRFLYTFGKNGVLHSATAMGKSTSPYFWVSAGAKLIIRNGVGETIQGALPTGDPSRVAYADVNPLDTENGKYPQNTFRLVTKKNWEDAEERVSFKITRQNLTNTPNRDSFSGIFLMGRYIDKDNLYYAGIRDDGLAIIKKKINGNYHTLAVAQVFGAQSQYHKTNKPSLIPQNKWMGLKMRAINMPNGSVRLTLFLDNANSGDWKSVVETVDANVGGDAFTHAGHGGIRTDYMDVQFDNFEYRVL